MAASKQPESGARADQVHDLAGRRSRCCRRAIWSRPGEAERLRSRYDGGDTNGRMPWDCAPALRRPACCSGRCR
jgi:hypothetical protein